VLDYKYTHYLEQFVTEERKAVFRKVLDQRTNHFTVAIEDIYQPHNASAVVRSCEVFGIQNLHIIENDYRFDASNNVAKGAQKWVDFTYYNSPEVNNSLVCMEKLKGEGYSIVATTPHTKACYLEEFDITTKSAFFFGVEKEGLSDLVLEKADVHLKIPMVGFTESLNISVAAAIILQCLTAKLRQSTLHWGLTQQEKDLRYQEWLEKTIKSIEKIKAHYFEDINPDGVPR
jgi:tRNA (guanosine-2'-O-)-methyltransferase